jgi:hypothetical protein
MNNAAELLKDGTSVAAGAALELLTKALSISLYSEKLLQMKAEALYLVFSIPIIFCTHHFAFLFCFSCRCYADLFCILWLIKVMFMSCSRESMKQWFNFVNRVSI